jgi:hypothetical protein
MTNVDTPVLVACPEQDKHAAFNPAALPGQDSG